MRMLSSARRRIAGWLEAHTALRFLIAGGVNTIFGFLVHATPVAANLSVRTALLIGMLAGSVFNFMTAGCYAFRQLALRRYPLFVVCYTVVYIVNVWIVEHIERLTGGPVAAQAVPLVPMALLSYWLMARWVFAVKTG